MTMESDKGDLRRMAELAYELGVEMSKVAAEAHDRLATEHGDRLAEVVTLNAAANMLANLIAVNIASNKNDEASDHIGEVSESIHKMVAELIGKGKKTLFIKIDRPERVDEAPAGE
jgi:hypothetical protein